MRLLMPLLLIYSVFIAACGRVWVSPGAEVDKKEAGIRFYGSTPYVWITPAAPSDKVNIATEQKTTNEPSGEKPSKTNVESMVASISKPSYAAQIVFLPDYEREYVIRWQRGLFGSVQPKFTLENGWNLTQFESTINTGLSGAISLQGSSASTSTKTTTEMFPADPEFQGPGLYKLKYDTTKQSWTLGPKVFVLN